MLEFDKCRKTSIEHANQASPPSTIHIATISLNKYHCKIFKEKSLISNKLNAVLVAASNFSQLVMNCAFFVLRIRQKQLDFFRSTAKSNYKL